MDHHQKVSLKGDDLVAQKRVAVIGTGLAGLTTAYLLRSDERGRYAVTLFEQVGWHPDKQHREDDTDSLTAGRPPLFRFRIRHRQE